MNYKKALEVLGLKNGYTEKELRSSFRRLAISYHPDHNDKGLEKMKEVNEAYEILKNKLANMDISKYKEVQLKKIERYYLKDIDLGKRSISMDSGCAKFYSDNGISYLGVIKNLLANYQLLSLDIETAKDRSSVDYAVNRFCDNVKDDYNKFIDDCFSNLYKDISYKKLIDYAKSSIQNITSIKDLIFSIYLSYDKVKQYDAGYKKFLKEKKVLISKYNELVDANIERGSNDFKRAAAYYKSMVAEKEIDKFNAIYKEAYDFVNDYVVNKKKEVVTPRVLELRSALLDKFYSTTMNDSNLNSNRVFIEILSRLFVVLDDILNLKLEDVNFDLFKEISFTNYDNDISVLNKIRKIKSEGIYLNKKFNSEDTNVYFAKVVDDRVDMYEFSLGTESISRTPISVSLDKFKNDYLELEEFFNKGRGTCFQIEGGYSLCEYNDIVLCLKSSFMDIGNYLVFARSDDVKKVPDGKNIEFDKNKTYSIICNKIYSSLDSLNIEHKKKR